jgi:hypothetical protein
VIGLAEIALHSEEIDENQKQWCNGVIAAAEQAAWSFPSGCPICRRICC